MKPVRTVEDLYPAIEELIAELKASGESKLSTILDHRMHRIAWTARSELFDELREVFRKALEVEPPNLPLSLRNDIQTLLQVISDYLERQG